MNTLKIWPQAGDTYCPSSMWLFLETKTSGHAFFRIFKKEMDEKTTFSLSYEQLPQMAEEEIQS